MCAAITITCTDLHLLQLPFWHTHHAALKTRRPQSFQPCARPACIIDARMHVAPHTSLGSSQLSLAATRCRCSLSRSLSRSLSPLALSARSLRSLARRALFAFLGLELYVELLLGKLDDLGRLDLRPRGQELAQDRVGRHVLGARPRVVKGARVLLVVLLGELV